MTENDVFFKSNGYVIYGLAVFESEEMAQKAKADL